MSSMSLRTLGVAAASPSTCHSPAAGPGVHPASASPSLFARWKGERKLAARAVVGSGLAVGTRGSCVVVNEATSERLSDVAFTFPTFFGI